MSGNTVEIFALQPIKNGRKKKGSRRAKAAVNRTPERTLPTKVRPEQGKRAKGVAFDPGGTTFPKGTRWEEVTTRYVTETGDKEQAELEARALAKRRGWKVRAVVLEAIETKLDYS